MSLRNSVLNTRNAAAVPLRAVATPEWPDVDGKLFLRMLSSFEADEYFSSMEADESEGNFRARFVCKVLVDENGNRVLQDDDAPTIGHKEISVIERIYFLGRDHNGLTPGNRQGLVKNFASGVGDGSPTSSPEQ